MGRSEKAITRAIMDDLRGMGFWVVKIHGGAYQMAGLPDVLAIKNGRAFWIEVKKPGEKPTLIQQKRLRDLQAAGCVVGVATSEKEAREIVNGY